MMRSFHLYHRKETEVLYVRFLNESTGTYGTGKSTGCKNRAEAERKAMEWLITGSIPKRGNAKVPQDTLLTTQQLIDALSHSPLALHDAKRILSLRSMSDSRIPADFLLEFWDYDKSPYIKEKLARGHSIMKKLMI